MQSVFLCYLLLAAVKEKVLGRMGTLYGVPLSWGLEEGQLWSGGTCLGERGNTGFSWRDKCESIPLVVRQLCLLSSLTLSMGTGAAGWLSDCFHLNKSKIFPKKAEVSIQTEDIVALWNSLKKVVETVFSIFEIRCLRSAACAKMGWGKRQGENTWFLLIKMIDYYSVW